ncbi:MAG: DUF1501 domain-containing protein [Verrucomicrobiales bacterium]
MYDDAVRLMQSADLSAFDLTKESAETREAYGKDSFGQGCLLARRLVEAGVRYVEVTLGGMGHPPGKFRPGARTLRHSRPRLCFTGG